MTNFKEYLGFDEEEFIEPQEKVIGKIEISEDDKLKIKDIKPIEVLMFAEPHCPDCRTVVAVMENVVKLNPNITVVYKSRRGNEEELNSISPEGRIPTMVVNGKVVLSEYPQSVKDEITMFNKDLISKGFRTGKYNNDVVSLIINSLS